MKRVCFALAAATLVAAAMPFPAQAYCRGCAVGAGVIGGIAAGAIIGSAIANSGQPNPGVSYVPPPRDPGVEPADEPNDAKSYDAMDSAACHIEKQQRWVDGVGRRWTNVEICE